MEEGLLASGSWNRQGPGTARRAAGGGEAPSGKVSSGTDGKGLSDLGDLEGSWGGARGVSSQDLALVSAGRFP